MRPTVRIQEKILIEAELVAPASVTGTHIDLKEVIGFSVQCISTEDVAAVQGSFKLEVSNNETSWETLPDSEFTLTGNDSIVVEYKWPFFKFVRPAVTLTSGTATVVSNFYGKCL